MGRRLRHYLPGVPFHITARIALQQQLFERDDIKTSVCRYIEGASSRCDAKVIACCVMRNHLHLIVVQGTAPLSILMQPILSRTAMCVQRRCGVDGRVFKGRFYAEPLRDPHYLRTCIVYVHLNPCRAGMVANPDDYKWSSHRLYAGLPAEGAILRAVQPEVQLFASGDADASANSDYTHHILYRRFCDGAAGVNGAHVSAPSAGEGDLFWLERYAREPHQDLGGLRARSDLRDIAHAILKQRAPHISIDWLRGRGRSRIVSAIRREIILATAAAGHPRTNIARFLCISEARVSQVAAAPSHIVPG